MEILLRYALVYLHWGQVKSQGWRFLNCVKLLIPLIHVASNAPNRFETTTSIFSHHLTIGCLLNSDAISLHGFDNYWCVCARAHARKLCCRKGIKSVVLERSDSLQYPGAAIAIYANGWRALDQMGVGTKLRSKAIPLQM